MGGGVTREYQCAYRHDEYYQIRTEDEYLQYQMKIKLVSCSFDGIKLLLLGEQTREKLYVQSLAKELEHNVRRLAYNNVRSYNKVTQALE